MCQRLTLDYVELYDFVEPSTYRGHDMKRFLRWLRFGQIKAKVKAVDGGVPSEIEYRGRRGTVVGYWAYGCYDPTLPFQG